MINPFGSFRIILLQSSTHWKVNRTEARTNTHLQVLTVRLTSVGLHGAQVSVSMLTWELNIVRRPDDSRDSSYILPLTFLIYYRTSIYTLQQSPRPQNGPADKSIRGWGRRLTTKTWLKYFAHSSRNFYGEGQGAKLGLVFRLHSPLRPFRNRAIYPKSKRISGALTIGLQLYVLSKFGVVRPTTSEKYWLVGSLKMGRENLLNHQ